MITLSATGAVLVGLAGAGHCLGMCGGVAAALTFALPDQNSLWRKTGYLLLYNVGRILGYYLAGLLLGGLFASLADLAAGKTLLLVLRLLAAVMMIALGLYMGQWWFGLQRFEALGQHVWKRVKPLAQAMIPLKNPFMALPLGFVWGWLPCGLVYSTLTWASASGSALSGAAIMLGFGLGTLPAMLVVGQAASQLRNFLSGMLFKRTSAVLLLLYGAQTAYIAIQQLT